MPGSYLIFGDIEGKLVVLRVECRSCARKGRYQVHELIAKYGRNGNVMKCASSSTATVRAATRIASKSAAT